VRHESWTHCACASCGFEGKLRVWLLILGRRKSNSPWMIPTTANQQFPQCTVATRVRQCTHNPKAENHPTNCCKCEDSCEVAENSESSRFVACHDIYLGCIFRVLSPTIHGFLDHILAGKVAWECAKVWRMPSSRKRFPKGLWCIQQYCHCETQSLYANWGRFWELLGATMVAGGLAPLEA